MIFISYRRADSAYTADRIFDSLKRRYGKHAVFMDVDSIRAGNDFRRVLKDYLYQSDVLLAIIGKEWVAMKDDSGQRRLDREDDYVRQEILTALDRGIPVIPLVIDGAQMPSSRDLPSALQDLAFRNAIKIRPSRDFEPDMKLLIETLQDEWYVRPDSWWRAFLPRRATPKSSTAEPRAPGNSGEAKAPERATGRSSESRSVEAPIRLDDSLVNRVRRLTDEPPSPARGSSSLDRWTRVTQCYVRSGIRITGPFDEHQLRAMRGRGEISPIHEISPDRVHWESAAGLVQFLDGAKPAWGSSREPSRSRHDPPSSADSHPTVPPPRPETPADVPQWYYANLSGERMGPVSQDELIELLKTKSLSRATFVCRAGATEWQRVSAEPVFAPFVPPGPGRMVAVAVSITLIISVLAVLLLALLSRARAAPLELDTRTRVPGDRQYGLRVQEATRELTAERCLALRRINDTTFTNVWRM